MDYSPERVSHTPHIYYLHTYISKYQVFPEAFFTDMS